MTVLYDLYRVRSHERFSRPDARERILTGTTADVSKYYSDLTHAQRMENRYLVAPTGTDEGHAVDASEWMRMLPDGILVS